MNPALYSSNTLVNLSQQFVYAVKTGASITSQLDNLKNIPYPTLLNDLKSDEEKKAFWINVYNGFSQMSLKEKPDQFDDRSTFYKAKQVIIADKLFSFDEIEHGILRRSKIKWALGYLNNLFPSKTEKQLRVGKIDFRIHFALNCGAKSCPPIAFYDSDKLDVQLNLATSSYLVGEVEYNSLSNTIYLPAIMNWFRQDFGGKKGMYSILKNNGILLQTMNPKIKFKKYDWTLYLNNYQN